MATRPLDIGTLPPTEALEIENGLTLVPRLKLLLTINPTDTASSTKLIDEWKVSQTLIEFLKTSFSVPIILPEEDVRIKRFKDLKKRKREDPMAKGVVFVRDLGFVKSSLKKYESVELGEKLGDDEGVVMERKLKEWRKLIVEKMDGIELNLEGSKYKLSLSMPKSDDFDGMMNEWEEAKAFGNRGHSRGGRQQQPDTIVIRGVPSRWFAEPRVSSKPSMLVTHTIFSFFGKIRNISVAEDDDLGEDGDREKEDIVPGLNCKIVARFENCKDFSNALRALSGRSLQKQGSRMVADYEVTWETSYSQRSGQDNIKLGGRYGSDVSRHQPYVSRYSPENGRAKRFRE